MKTFRQMVEEQYEVIKPHKAKNRNYKQDLGYSRQIEKRDKFFVHVRFLIYNIAMLLDEKKLLGGNIKGTTPIMSKEYKVDCPCCRAYLQDALETFNAVNNSVDTNLSYPAFDKDGKPETRIGLWNMVEPFISLKTGEFKPFIEHHIETMRRNQYTLRWNPVNEIASALKCYCRFADKMIGGYEKAGAFFYSLPVHVQNAVDGFFDSRRAEYRQERQLAYIAARKPRTRQDGFALPETELDKLAFIEKAEAKRKQFKVNMAKGHKMLTWDEVFMLLPKWLEEEDYHGVSAKV